VSSAIVQETHYDPWGLELTGLGYQYGGIKANKYLYNGKELLADHNLGLYDYGARYYDPAIGRWISIDPAAHEYSSFSPYNYVLNRPINAIDPDGKRVFFVAGAGNDQIGWDYVHRWGRAFERSGITGFTRLNVSHDNPERLRSGSLPVGDMMFSSSFRSSRYDRFASSTSGMVTTSRKQSKIVDKAIGDISANLTANPLEEGEQLNLAGYSYGSVVQAHAALGLAD
jgi:RHS repeat-associated protein